MLNQWQRTPWRSIPLLNRRRRPLGAEERLGRYLLGIAVVCLALYLYLLPASQSAQARYQMLDVQRQYYEQVDTNAETIVEISRYTNMAALEERAKAAGFVEPSNRVYVPVPAQPVDPAQAAAPGAASTGTAR